MPTRLPRGPDMMSNSLLQWNDHTPRGRFIYSALVLRTGIYTASVDAGFGLLGID
jgi:hypothetical protein